MPSNDVIHHTLRAGAIVHYDAMFAHGIVTLTIRPFPFASLYVIPPVSILGTLLADVGGVSGLSSLVIYTIYLTVPLSEFLVFHLASIFLEL